MASWLYSIGNLARRAPAAPAAVAPATADALYGLANLANDYPDQPAGFAWRADGTYAVDVDANLLAATSAAVDAPTGWKDLLYLLAGTPGLPAQPPDWNTYAGRTALRLFRPVVQEVEVMPGEAVTLECGLHEPVASAATGIRVRVIDTSTGKGWDGTANAWAASGVVAEQSTDDTWLDVSEVITADTARTEKAIYRVIIEPIAVAWDATTYVYASANGASGVPSLCAEWDTAAIIGHNLPADAVVTVGALTLVPLQPSMYTTGSAVYTRMVRISIQMPAGNQARPVIGELWIGKARTLLVGSPVVPIGLEESSPGQVQLVGARGRREIIGEDAIPVRELAMQFRTATDAAYQQVRDGIARLTRFGADPLLLLPSTTFEPGLRVVHGRIEDRVSYSRITPAAADPVRDFSMPLHESPFAAAG